MLCYVMHPPLAFLARGTARSVCNTSSQAKGWSLIRNFPEAIEQAIDVNTTSAIGDTSHTNDS